MLEHSGDALLVFAGFWRFVLSGTFRRGKIAEWREARHSRGGRLAVALEIVVGVVIGLGLPAALIALITVAL